MSATSNLIATCRTCSFRICPEKTDVYRKLRNPGIIEHNGEYYIKSADYRRVDHYLPTDLMQIMLCLATLKQLTENGVSGPASHGLQTQASEKPQPAQKPLAGAQDNNSIEWENSRQSPLPNLPATSIDWQKLLLSPPMTASEIATALGEPIELVEPVMRYFRKEYDYGFVKDDRAGVGESRFRYKMEDVLSHIQKWYAKRQRKKSKSAGQPAA